MRGTLGYQTYFSFKAEEGKQMKEAFDMKNLLHGNQTS